MKKPVDYVILALLVGVFLFAAYKVGSYYLEKYRSDKVISEANRFVTLPGDSDNNDPTQDPSGDPECPTVQFDELLKTNGDVIAWIYGANTHINYPVVQGSDNDYYLRHLLHGLRQQRRLLRPEQPDLRPQYDVRGHVLQPGEVQAAGLL